MIRNRAYYVFVCLFVCLPLSANPWDDLQCFSITYNAQIYDCKIVIGFCFFQVSLFFIEIGEKGTDVKVKYRKCKG